MNNKSIPFLSHRHIVGAFLFTIILGLLLPACAWAAVTESFDGITDAAYGDVDDYGAWLSNNSLTSSDATKTRGGTGKCLVMDNDAGAYLLYEGADGNGKDTGLGIVSVWYRHWDADGKSVAFQVEYSQNGGPWTAIGSAVTVTSTTYAEFSEDANLAGDNIQVRFSSTAASERLCLDDVTLNDMSGPAEDPNLVSASSLSFGPLVPGTSETQTLSIANSGASNTLNLSSFSATSGDTGYFSVGAIPATLAPGGSTNIPVVYTPGMETGVYHSAIYTLNTDDPTTPAYAITFGGQTIGASMTVSNIQYSGGGTTSPENGNQVTVTGIATYADPYGYAIADPDGGPWSGIYITDVNHRPEIGDQVLVEGWVSESDSMTILSSVSEYQTLGTGFSVPATTITGSQLATESYEGVYVRINTVTVNDINVGGAEDFWQVTDGSSVRVGTRVPYRYIWQLSDTLDAVQGIVFIEGTTRSVQPSSDWDLIGRPVYEYALRGLVMTPDGPRTNWYVHVEDDLIMAVTNVQPGGITILDTGGIIFPGLIDAHNHPAYNSFPTLMFNNFPFSHRDEWGKYDAEYDDWKDKRNSLRSAIDDYSQQSISKYAECLELMAGCIAIQGNYSDPEYAHPDVILYNIEQFPARTWADIFPWTSTSGERTTLLDKTAGGSVNATLIHLCEGPDATSLAQFYTWRDWGMLNETTAIIHGTPLGASEFAEMAAVGAKILWSPMSNMKLYGETADVKTAKEAGVLVGLSPDWTPSGCFNMLEELGYAWELNQTMFESAFTPKEMCDMVTLNNAKCAGLDARYGKIEVGYNAGLAVIEGDTANPYMALINARPPDVLLTIVNGTPRYGEPALMTALGASGESVDIRGRTKTFNIAVDHPFLDYGDQTFAEIRANLQTGHATLTPYNELDREELQFLDIALLQGSGGDDIEPFLADNPISSGPGTGTYDQGSVLSLSFRYQDFWDNDTFITNLTHTISIVPALYPELVLQTIASDRANTPANETVPFTIDFQDMHTNYTFAFVTTDDRGNQRTSTMSSTTFKLAYHTGGDSDGDGMPNEWETTYFGNFTNGIPTGNTDGDALDNLGEYVAVTIPTSAGSCLSTTIDALEATVVGTMQMQSPIPTSTERLYDVWWSSNLVGEVVWQAMGLNVPGAAGGESVTLRVTNALPTALYRTGVKLPE